MNTGATRKKIYIAGAGGMLGDAFYKVFSPFYQLKCSDINLTSSWLDYLDFRSLDDYKSEVFSFRPDYLFHLGAHTDLEYCDTNPDDAYITNTLSVENAVYIANTLKIPLLFISTAGIFDGLLDQYDDWDIPNPLGHYARSKWAAEKYVQSSTSRHLICRAGWMMGGGPSKDKKFVQKILHQIKNGSKQLFVVDDKLGTPTYTIDFAKNVKLLLESEVWGLYNLVCNGQASRLEVATEIVRLTGKYRDLEILPVDSSHFQNEYFSMRPASERLLTKKLDLRGLNIMRDWKTCLKEYISEYYCDYL